VLVSVIIPVKNGLKWLKESLPVFLSQKIIGEFEIIILDSGSTDKISQFIAYHNYKNVKYFNIEPSTFNHGLTRNIGVNYAAGKYIAFTVQDAKPIDENWLHHLLSGFLDEDVVAVCGQQIVPHNLNNNPILWFKPVNTPSIKKIKLNQSELCNISPDQLRQYASWDNVVSCYLREILINYPFKESPFSEDLEWARDALLRGEALSYNTNAIVEHYHFGYPDYVYHRYMAESLSKYRIFGVIPQQPKLSIRKWLSWFKTLISNSHIPFLKKIFWLKHNIDIHRNELKAYKEFNNYFENNKIDYLIESYNKIIPIGNRN
jgi:rhamnosyltransferase